jgi:hypothetical protein
MDRGKQTVDLAMPHRVAADAAMREVNNAAQSVAVWSDRQTRQLALRLARRSRTPPAAPDLQMLDRDPATSVLGQWSGLANAVTAYAVGLSGVPAGGELLGVLRAVSGSENAQDRLLKKLDAKVDALVRGPYNTGRTLLLEAQRHGERGQTDRPTIERARDAFFTAHGQAASVQSRALVEYHLGVTLLLLDQQDDAIFWLSQSHASAAAVVYELARQAADVDLSAGTLAAAVALLGPAGILGAKVKKLVVAERVREVLEDFIPFVGCAARSHNCLVDPSQRLPELELVATDGGRFELESVGGATKRS